MFFSQLEWFIAKRYLKTKRKESFIKLVSWFSLIGITLGVAVLIIVMSVMNGFRKDLVKSIVGIDGHLTIQNISGGFITNQNDTIKKISEVKEVTGAGASINTEGLASSQYYSAGVMVKGLTMKDLQTRHIKINSHADKVLKNFQNNQKTAIVGEILAKNLGLKIGDTLRVVFPQFDSTALGFIPKYITFKVDATFNTGMYQYDSNMIFVPLGITQLLYHTSGVQTIEVFIKNPLEVAEVKKQIQQQIGYLPYISTWQENNYSLISALNTERNVMFIILVLIIMIAAFNIMSSLIMLVRSKTKEIAILKAMGFSSGNIQKIFLIIGLRMGLSGTITGVIIGILFSYNIERIRLFLQNVFHINLFNENVYFLSHIPADISLLQISIIAFVSLGLSIFASIYPSKKAAAIITAEALRYE